MSKIVSFLNYLGINYEWNTDEDILYVFDYVITKNRWLDDMFNIGDGVRTTGDINYVKWLILAESNLVSVDTVAMAIKGCIL